MHLVGKPVGIRCTRFHRNRLITVEDIKHYKVGQFMGCGSGGGGGSGVCRSHSCSQSSSSSSSHDSDADGSNNGWLVG